METLTQELILAALISQRARQMKDAWQGEPKTDRAWLLEALKETQDIADLIALADPTGGRPQ